MLFFDVDCEKRNPVEKSANLVGSSKSVLIEKFWILIFISLIPVLVEFGISSFVGVKLA